MPITRTVRRQRSIPKPRRSRAPKRRGRPTLNFGDPTLAASELEPRVTCWDMHIHRGPSGDRDYAAEGQMEKSFRRVFGRPKKRQSTTK